MRSFQGLQRLIHLLAFGQGVLQHFRPRLGQFNFAIAAQLFQGGQEFRNRYRVQGHLGQKTILPTWREGRELTRMKRP
jgi:hypothetical protein